MKEQNPPVPAFLSKLWALVEDPASEDVIAWNWDGQNFCIRDEQRFCREILPRYFKHNNLSSFIRQLNMYGFRKVMSLESGLIQSESSSAIEFQHPYFKKGKAELLENIKRKVSAVKSDDSSFPQDELHKVLTELRDLKDIQTSMDTKLDHMRRENQALWTEVASLRRKHSQQQKLLAKILQFILSLIGNIVMSPKRKRPLTIEAPQSPAAKYSRSYLHTPEHKGQEVTRLAGSAQVSLSSQHPDVTADNLLVIHEGSGSGEGPSESCSPTTGKSNQCTPQFVTPAIPDSYKDTGQAVFVDVLVPDIQPAASDLTVVPSNAASADGLELDLASSTDDVINSILNENCSSATLDREEIQDFLSCIDASLEELQTMLSKKNLNMSSDIIEEDHHKDSPGIFSVDSGIYPGLSDYFAKSPLISSTCFLQLFNPDLSSSDISVTGPPASLSNDMKANRAEGVIPGSDDELYKGKQLMQYTGNPLLSLFDELPSSDYGAAAPDSANLLASVEEDVFPSSSSEHCYAAPEQDSIRDLDPQAEEFESCVPIYVLSPVNKLLEEVTQPETL